MNITRFGYRRTAAVGAVWVAALAALVGGSSPAYGQADSAGVGNAYAQGYKIDPRSGRLSFGITYGIALAGHQNSSARAESRSMDLGLIGGTLAGEGCDGGEPTFPKEDQPVPLTARTDDAEAKSKNQPELGVERSVEVSEIPFAKAVAITSGFGEPAVVGMGGTTSTTTSGLENGFRVARAISEVSEINIGGVLQIKGMRWEAAYQTFPTTAVLTSFTVEGVFLAGQNITGPTDDPFAGIGEATKLLELLGIGLEVTTPQLRHEQGIAFVDPMRISIVPGETRDTVVGGVLSAAQPLREALVDTLVEADCGNAAYVTVADIAVGSVTGAGELNIELGGVTATSSDIDATSFLGGLSDFTPAVPAPTPSVTPTPAPTQTATVSAPSVVATPTTTETAAPSAPAPEPVSALPEIEPIDGSRGGALLGVGLGGLFLLGALAEGDRRKMRRGQRSGPMEVKA